MRRVVAKASSIYDKGPLIIILNTPHRQKDGQM